MTTSAEIGTEGTLQIAEHFVPAQSGNRRRFSWGLLVAYILLAIGGVCMVTPFIWMILTSVKPPPELVNFSFFPANPTLQNYLNVLNTSSFERWYLNSIIVAAISTTSVVFFDTLVGYTLNKFSFPGKNLIFIGMLGTLMIPTEMLIIPWYTMSVNWNWHLGYTQYWGIAFPGVITAAGIFLMRQFFDGVPNELLDAARMEHERVRNLVENRRAAGQTGHCRPGYLQLYRQLERLPVAADSGQQSRVLYIARRTQFLPRRIHHPLGEDYDRGQPGQHPSAHRLPGLSTPDYQRYRSHGTERLISKKEQYSRRVCQLPEGSRNYSAQTYRTFHC